MKRAILTAVTALAIIGATAPTIVTADDMRPVAPAGSHCPQLYPYVVQHWPMGALHWPVLDRQLGRAHCDRRILSRHRRQPWWMGRWRP
jgi:hypothetical protein